jgi:type IX secretion system substrate protein
MKMKSMLLMIALAFLTVTASSQIRLTKADYDRFYVATSVDHYTTVDIETARMDVGLSGSGNVYDLNTIDFVKENACNYLDPLTTPFANRFPNATHSFCQKWKNSSSIVFYKLTNDALYLEGSGRVIDGIPFVNAHDGSRTLVKFPAQVGTSWTYEGEVQNSSPGSMTQTITTFDFDANGTMAIGFEVQPCLRLKTVDYNISEQTFNGQTTRSVIRGISFTFITREGVMVTAVIDTLDEYLETPRLQSLHYFEHKFGPVSVDGPGLASSIVLEQNYPNPVSASNGSLTRIDWSLEHQGYARLALYDLTGREKAVLFDGLAEQGQQSATLDASGLNPGTYYIRLQNGGEVKTRMLSVLK